MIRTRERDQRHRANRAGPSGTPTIQTSQRGTATRPPPQKRDTAMGLPPQGHVAAGDAAPDEELVALLRAIKAEHPGFGLRRVFREVRGRPEPRFAAVSQRRLQTLMQGKGLTCDQGAPPVRAKPQRETGATLLTKEGARGLLLNRGQRKVTKANLRRAKESLKKVISTKLRKAKNLRKVKKLSGKAQRATGADERSPGGQKSPGDVPMGSA